MTEWQPIASAPKDGSEILISDEAGNMMVVYYDEPSKDAPSHCWHRSDGLAYHKNFPTHWMPLPEPPK